VGIFAWLFGKKEGSDAPRQEPAAIAHPSPVQRPAAPVPAPPKQEPAAAAGGNGQRAPAVSPEAENLKRWRESGRARAWVEARGGRWDHAAWLALLDELRGSSFWPMDPDAVGLVLEEEHRQWLRRQ
jgi:hypothetical protein